MQKTDKDATETLAMCQSPVMPLGILPGITVEDESGSYYITFPKGPYVWQVLMGLSRPGNEKTTSDTALGQRESSD